MIQSGTSYSHSRQWEQAGGLTHSMGIDARIDRWLHSCMLGTDSHRLRKTRYISKEPTEVKIPCEHNTRNDHQNGTSLIVLHSKTPCLVTYTL